VIPLDKDELVDVDVVEEILRLLNGFLFLNILFSFAVFVVLSL